MKVENKINKILMTLVSVFLASTIMANVPELGLRPSPDWKRNDQSEYSRLNLSKDLLSENASHPVSKGGNSFSKGIPEIRPRCPNKLTMQSVEAHLVKRLADVQGITNRNRS